MTGLIALTGTVVTLFKLWWFHDMRHDLAALILSGSPSPGHVRRLIAGIMPDGGTQIAPALNESYRRILPVNATYRHIVLLTDGISEEGDSLTLSRYAAIPRDKAVQLLQTIERTLESRHNKRQPYGDWGVLCAFPPFKRVRDIRAKTAFAFRYHNGSDWPYWDGVYAEERLRHGLGGVRYALTRWWQYCLAQGWAGPVEYFSPPFGRGSLLQGWSAMPAAVVLKYGAAALGEALPALEAAS